MLLKELSEISTTPELPIRDAIDFSHLSLPKGGSAPSTRPAIGTFEAVAVEKPQTTVYLPHYNGLDPHIQALLSPRKYQELSTPKKLAFLTITTQLLSGGAPLSYRQ